MGKWIWGALKAALFLMALYALLLLSQWLTLSPEGSLRAQAVATWAVLAMITAGCARRSDVLDAPALAFLAAAGAYAAWVLWPTWGPEAIVAGLYWAPSALGWLLAGWGPLAKLSLRPGQRGHDNRKPKI